MNINNEYELLGPPKKSSVLKKVAIIGGSVIVFAAIILSVLILVTVSTSNKNPKNLILILGDGFGFDSLTLARIGSNRNLTMDKIFSGKISTRSYDSLVTDSAAGATAYSCGLKTINYRIAVDHNGKACGTLFESAQRKGFKTGIVVTSEFTHATPASFAAHAMSRDMLQFIGEQMIEKTPDVLLGGGLAIIKQRNETLYKFAKEKFKTLITHKDELVDDLQLPVFGVFADNHLNYSIDKSETQPSLARMTEQALKYLTRNKKDKFFLFIEGSRIDHAGHENDVASHYHEVLAFDDALKVVVDFAEKDKNTLVVVVADHETGGLSLGKEGVYHFDVENLNKIHRSARFITDWITSHENYTVDTIEEGVEKFTDLSFTILDRIKYFPDENNLKPDVVFKGITSFFSDKTRAGWTTGGHTGVDVNLFSAGKKSEQFRGVFRNDEIGRMLEKMFNLDLDEITQELKDFDPNPPGADLTKDEYESHHSM